MALPGFRKSSAMDVFPFDLVDAWVNLYDPADVVTTGRGLGCFYEACLDVPIALPRVAPQIANHSLRHYTSHGSLAEALRARALDEALVPTAVVSADGSIAGFELLLLQFAYLNCLIRRADGKQLASLRTARQFLLDVLVAHAPDVDRPRVEALFADPAAHLAGLWNDAEFVPLAVALLTQLPASPFELPTPVAAEAGREALSDLLDRIRTHTTHVEPRDGSSSTNISNAVYAEHISDAVEDALAEESGWARRAPIALVALGVGVLAVTGVGLLAAVPAGLAGGAAITATLASFGPGGMVGGMAALASLASTGSALVAGGGARALGQGDVSSRSVRLDEFESAVVSASASDLASILGQFRAIVIANDRLELGTAARDRLESLTSSARARYAPLVAMHEEISPQSKTTKSAVKKLAMLDKFVEWCAASRLPSELAERPWLPSRLGPFPGLPARRADDSEPTHK